MFLPTFRGNKDLNIHRDRPIHINGHKKYNQYIGLTLDMMLLDGKTSEHHMCEFNKKLKQSMRHLDIPW
jgi:hypothetical protein